MDYMDYNNIRNQIKDKHKQNSVILQKIKKLRTEYDKINKEIALLSSKYPKCYSCGKHQDPTLMIKATQHDIDNYVDNNEGYCGPEINEYYCGC